MARSSPSEERTSWTRRPTRITSRSRTTTPTVRSTRPSAPTTTASSRRASWGTTSPPASSSSPTGRSSSRAPPRPRIIDHRLGGPGSLQPRRYARHDVRPWRDHHHGDRAPGQPVIFERRARDDQSGRDPHDRDRGLGPSRLPPKAASSLASTSVGASIPPSVREGPCSCRRRIPSSLARARQSSPMGRSSNPPMSRTLRVSEIPRWSVSTSTAASTPASAPTDQSRVLSSSSGSAVWPIARSCSRTGRSSSAVM